MTIDHDPLVDPFNVLDTLVVLPIGKLFVVHTGSVSAVVLQRSCWYNCCICFKKSCVMYLTKCQDTSV